MENAEQLQADLRKGLIRLCQEFEGGSSGGIFGWWKRA